MVQVNDENSQSVLIDQAQEKAHLKNIVPRGTNLMDSSQLFKIEQVRRITGMTEPMIDYLCRSKFLIPSVAKGSRGRGKRRLFSYADLLYVKSIRSLLSKGVSIKRIGACLAALHEECAASCKSVDIAEIRLLVTNGADVFRMTNDQTIENLAKGGQYEFLFVLDHSKIRSDLDAQLIAEKKTAPPKKAARSPI